MNRYLVGYARRDISPTQPAPLGGYGDTSKRLHADVIDPLYATAIAITDADDVTVLLLTVDLANTPASNREKFCAMIWEKLHIPETHVFLTATHTHSAPDQGNHEIPYMAEFIDTYLEKAVQAATHAYEDRKPAKMFYSAANTEGLNFVRHYLREDGTYSGPGFGTSKAPIVAHSYDPDPEMRLIRFQREGGRDVLLMNWQAHGTMNSSQHKTLFPFCSADFITGIRVYMEEQENCHFAYFQGAAGDHMPTSEIEEETKTRNIYAYGKLLGAVAQTALKQEKEAAGGPIRVKSAVFTAEINHTDDRLLDKAEQVMAYFRETQSTPQASVYARELGLISRHHAGSIVRRSTMDKTYDLDCSVLQIGDVGFAAAPDELFGSLGVTIREKSGYDMTFILGYCNGNCGYVPSRRAYDYFSYEVGCSNFAPGVGEALAEHLAEKLRELKNA